MSMFALAISHLTTSNLRWFMDLTFQIPMQYCSLQHRTLLLSPVTSIAGYCFCFGSIPSFFLGLFLHWFSVTCWAPLSVSYHFAFSYCSWELKARILKWFAIPFSSGPHSVRLSTMTRLSWVAPRAWLSFIELDKAVALVWLDWLVFTDRLYWLNVLY